MTAMAKKIDPPNPPMIPARWHGGAQTPTKRIVIHGTVSPCVKGGARDVARFFATHDGKTSAHYVVDPGEVIQCVGDHQVAYAAPPNQDTLHVELCDPVAGRASRWSDAPHEAMLERAADLVARLGLAYDIPLTRLSGAQLKGGKRGICGHVDVSQAWHQTTHTDPGPDFPWTRFMAMVAAAAKKLQGTTAPPPATPPKPAPAPGKPKAEKLALDYSWARPVPDAVKAAGFRGVVRYLSLDTTGKNISVVERKALHAAGLWVMLVWENGKTRAGEGALAGTADVEAAEAMADALGYPRSCAIFYAVDYDAKPAAVKPYLDAVKKGATRPVGVYGGFDIIEALKADYYWQAAAWSEGKVSSKANLYQRIGTTKTIAGSKAGDWDEDVILHGIIPVWNPGEKPYVPPKPPVVTPPPVPVTPTPVPESEPEQTPAPVVSFINAQFNSQHTDKDNRQIRDVLIACDLAGLNEIESLWQRLILKTSPKFGVFPTLGTAGYVPIAWRKSVFDLVDSKTVVVHPGVSGATPTRNINRVTLRHKATGQTVTRINTQVVHHIDQGGNARRTDQIAGQNARGELHFDKLLVEIQDALTLGPVIVCGDFNVDYWADKRRVAAAKGTSWFPYTQFVESGLLEAAMPKSTHSDGRAIDWTLVNGLTVFTQNVGKQGASDHLPVFTTLAFKE